MADKIAFINIRDEGKTIEIESWPSYSLVNIQNTSAKKLSENINHAVSMIDTEWFVRIDGDDCILQYGYYQLAENQIGRNKPCAFVPTYVLLSSEKLGYCFEFQGAGVMVNRECFLETKYDNNLDYQADLDFYIRFNRKHVIENANIKYYWMIGNNRSIRNKARVLQARKSILSDYSLSDSDVHHFGAYAYT